MPRTTLPEKRRDERTMFAVIRTGADGSITQLRICHSREAAIIAPQLEKDRLPMSERGSVTAVCMDDGGYTEIAV